MEIEELNGSSSKSALEKKVKKPGKKGIIYLSTIPPFYNVTRIREAFEPYGQVGRIFLQLEGKEPKLGKDGQIKKKKVSKRFTEGWVEFEKKSVAKKVVRLLNNKQVDTRKKSKQYDSIWNMKYLSNFKWIHLNERLAYERAARRQKLKAEIRLAKKQADFFTLNVDKFKRKKKVENKSVGETTSQVEQKDAVVSDRGEFLKNLFSKSN